MSYAPSVEFLNVLREEFNIDVVTRVPVDRADMFIRVDYANGKANSPITEVRTVAVQVYGHDFDEVVKLSYRLRMFLLDRVYATSPKIVWWEEEAGPHEFPDPDLDTVHRWQITGNLTVTLT